MTLQAQIDSKISGGKTSLYFPERKIKYYTAITIEDWQYHNPITGEVAPALDQLGEAIADLAAKLPITFAGTKQFTALIKLLTKIGPEFTEEYLNTAKVVPERKADIRLPLPTQIIDMHRVKWDEKAMLPIKSLVETTKVGRAGEQYFRGFTGLAPNEFHTILFDRPEFKTHELNFTLSPKNASEANMMQRIYVTLNNAMSPSMAWSNLMFKFPMVINVTLMPAPGRIMKFKPAVIDAISTNFTPNATKGFYHDVRPESMIISMQLTEIEYWINRSTSYLEAGDYNQTHGVGVRSTGAGAASAGVGQTAAGTIRFEG